MHKILFLIFSFFLFFFGTFINDFLFFGVPAFGFFWFFLVFSRYLVGNPIKRKEAIVQLLMLLVVFLPFLNEFMYGDEFYAFNYLYIVLYVNFLIFFAFMLDKHQKLVMVLTMLLIFIFSIVSFFLLFKGNLRASIGFGPNVLYRIYGFLFLIVFTLVLKNKKQIKINLKIGYCAYALSILSLLATGSRGATLVILFMSLCFFFFLLRENGAKYFYKVLIFFSVFVFFVVFKYGKQINDLFWRLLYFDFDNGSLMYRMESFVVLKDFLREDFDVDVFFGYTSVNGYFDYYPHNLLVELIIYSGFFLFFIMVFLSLFFVLYVFLSKERYLFFVYFPIFIGAMFSGNLYYNFTLISFFLYFSLLVFLRCIYGAKKDINNFSF